MDRDHEDLFTKINMICNVLKNNKKNATKAKTKNATKPPTTSKKSVSKITKKAKEKKKTVKAKPNVSKNIRSHQILAGSIKSTLSSKSRKSTQSKSVLRTSTAKSKTSSPILVTEKSKNKPQKMAIPPQFEKQTKANRKSFLVKSKKIHSNDDFLISQLKFKFSITLQKRFFRLWAVNYFHSIHRKQQRLIYNNLKISTINEFSFSLQSDPDDGDLQQNNPPTKLTMSESYNKNLEIKPSSLSTSLVNSYPQKGISVSQSVSEMFRKQKPVNKESSIQNQISVLQKLAASSDEDQGYEEEVQALIDNADKVLDKQKMIMIRKHLIDEETQSVTSIGSDLDISKRPLYQDLETDSQPNFRHKAKQNTRVAPIRKLKANYEEEREDFSEIAVSIKDIDVSPNTLLKRSERIISNYEVTSYKDPMPPKLNLCISPSSKHEKPEAPFNDTEGESFSDRIAALLEEKPKDKKAQTKASKQPKQKATKDDGICRAPPKQTQPEKPKWDPKKTTMFSNSSESDIDDIFNNEEIMARVSYTGSCIEKEVEQRRNENKVTNDVKPDEYNLGEEDYGTSIVGMEERLPKFGQRINLSTEDPLLNDREIAEKLEQLQKNNSDSDYDSIDELIKIQKSKNANHKISVCGIELNDSSSDDSFLEMRK